MNTVHRNKKELIYSTVPQGSSVLDVGFWGQGVNISNPNWVHNLLKERTPDIFGLDLDYDESKITGLTSNYFKISAEDFEINKKFDVIFAGDLIEHLSNPGKFLESCYRHSLGSTKLIITTPNCFNLYNIMEKLTKPEPTVNSDHTCYFNIYYPCIFSFSIFFKSRFKD